MKAMVFQMFPVDKCYINICKNLFACTSVKNILAHCRHGSGVVQL